MSLQRYILVSVIACKRRSKRRGQNHHPSVCLMLFTDELLCCCCSRQCHEDQNRVFYNENYANHNRFSHQHFQSDDSKLSLIMVDNRYWKRILILNVWFGLSSLLKTNYVNKNFFMNFVNFHIELWCTVNHCFDPCCANIEDNGVEIMIDTFFSIFHFQPLEEFFASLAGACVMW